MKATICLNMIVKNESHIIAETLSSIAPYIDDYIINDTGSTDNTIQVITDFFKKRGIPGQIFENEFRGFDYARSTALSLCKHSQSKYIWVIDADDILNGVPIFPQNMDCDCYYLQYGATNFVYLRNQIFRNDPSLEWHYVGVVHEYPKSGRTDYLNEGIIRGCNVDSRRLGDRSKNPNKYLDDALKLQARYSEIPTARDLFYCGNSYFDHVSMKPSFVDDPTYIDEETKFLELAAEKYRMRITEDDFPEEKFYSYLRLGETLERLGNSWEEIEKVYMDGYNFFPIRGTEIIHRITTHYYRLKEYEKAYEISQLAINIPFPETCKLFIHQNIYKYDFPLQYSLVCDHLKKYMEAYLISKQTLQIGYCDEEKIDATFFLFLVVNL